MQTPSRLESKQEFTSAFEYAADPKNELETPRGEHGDVAAAVLTFTLLTGISSLWPALRAAKLEPIVAIQRTA